MTSGAPPLDWWNASEEEVHRRLILAMCPARVCRTCGQPSVRETMGAGWRQPELAAHIKERREVLGITSAEINGWFGFKEIAKNWERTDKWGAAIPGPDVWPVLKERLGLSDEFDSVIRRRDGYEYVSAADGRLISGRTDYGRGGIPTPDPEGQKNATAKPKSDVRWSDCGHNDWRPGVVLDPFAQTEAESVL